MPASACQGTCIDRDAGDVLQKLQLHCIEVDPCLLLSLQATSCILLQADSKLPHSSAAALPEVLIEHSAYRLLYAFSCAQTPVWEGRRLRHVESSTGPCPLSLS